MTSNKLVLIKYKFNHTRYSEEKHIKSCSIGMYYLAYKIDNEHYKLITRNSCDKQRDSYITLKNDDRFKEYKIIGYKIKTYELHPIIIDNEKCYGISLLNNNNNNIVSPNDYKTNNEIINKYHSWKITNSNKYKNNYILPKIFENTFNKNILINNKKNIINSNLFKIDNNELELMYLV